MHNAMDLIRIELSNVLETMEENVSWEKKITAMDTFTTMYSAILETNFEADTVMFSMLTVSIQTSKLLKEVQKQVGTMQQRMEILLQEASQNQWKLQLNEMMTSGLLCVISQMRQYFGTVARIWYRRISSQTLSHSRNTQTGNLTSLVWNTKHLVQCDSTTKAYMSWMIGQQQ